MTNPDQSGTPPRSQLTPGLRIGKYVLGSRLGSGGMAEVWEASVAGAGDFAKPVAIKFILDPLANDPEYHRLFTNEARVASELHHSNLVGIFDFDKAPDDAAPAARGRYYIVMELVEGVDLYKMMCGLQDAGRNCPVGIALYVTGEILKGLNYIHTRRKQSEVLGLVHRDVSPQNVLVGYSGEVRVSDFGIAKSTKAQTTQGIRCKLEYCAPELLQGIEPSAYSDQFAVGIILWELLAGRMLFQGQHTAQILNKVNQCEIPPVGRTIAPAVQEMMMKMLARDPYQRFISTSQALTAIFGAPGYTPDGRPVGELLSFLFPDDHLRWVTPASMPRALNPLFASQVMPQRPTGPVPMAYPAQIVLDRETGEAMPLWPDAIGEPPFENLDPELWDETWRRWGFNRRREVFSPQGTMLVSSVPRRPIK